jgi:hypothetical protein
MKAKLVKKSLNEYQINDYLDDEEIVIELEIIKREAKTISAEENCAVHVNQITPGEYKIEDWYDYETTVASYEDGQIISESLKEEYSFNSDFKKISGALDLAGIPCKVQLERDGIIDVLCGLDYPDRITNEIWDIAEKLGIEVEIMADQAGGDIIDQRRLNGGPREWEREYDNDDEY